MKTAYYPIALMAALILTVGSAAFAADEAATSPNGSADSAMVLPIPPSATSSGVDIDRVDVSSPAVMATPPVGAGEAVREVVSENTGQLIVVGAAFVVLAGLFFWASKNAKRRPIDSVRPTRHNSKM